MYNDIEGRTTETAELFELYIFSREDAIWLCTSSYKDIEYDSEFYPSYPITRSSIGQNVEVSKSNLTIEVPRDLPFVQQFIATPLTVVTSCTILRGHYNDPDSDTTTIYRGRIVNIAFEEKVAKITVESVMTSLRRPFLRLRYNKNCPYDLYGQGCKVNKDAFATDVTVTVVNSVELQSDTFAEQVSGYYTGGYVKFATGEWQVYRFVILHSGNSVTMDLPIPQLETGMVVTAYPGCDRTLETCLSKFGNSDNYGGFPYFADKNPFGGDLIY